MSYPLIVVCGNAHSGKDTLVNSVANKKIFTTSFAAVIKDFLIDIGASAEHLYGSSNKRNEMMDLSHTDWHAFQKSAKNFFGLTNESIMDIEGFVSNNPTYREALRFVGDTVRMHDPDFFAKYAVDNCDIAIGHQDFDLAIISDGRFRNEILKVKAIGGTAILVSSDMALVDEHQSEKELAYIPNKWFDYVINNDKGNLEEAKKQFARIVEAKSGIRI